MPDKRRRRWNALVDDDPLAGLINLFDLWMVFSIALVVSFATSMQRPHTPPDTTVPRTTAAVVSPTDPIPDRVRKLPRYRLSRDELSGEGVRLGTAYRLKSGEVVYVPDTSVNAPPAAR